MKTQRTPLQQAADTAARAARDAAAAGNAGTFDAALFELCELAELIGEPWAKELAFEVEWDGSAMLERYEKGRKVPALLEQEDELTHHNPDAAIPLRVVFDFDGVHVVG